MSGERTSTISKQVYRVETDKMRSGRVTIDVARRIKRVLESRGENATVVPPARGRTP